MIDAAFKPILEDVGNGQGYKPASGFQYFTPKIFKEPNTFVSRKIYSTAIGFVQIII
jgi:hypothetical protein